MQTRNRRASVEDRWHKTIRLPDGTTDTVPSKAYGSGKRWRARYVDDEGREHSRGFARKTDAQSWLDTEITAKFATGTYVDPQLGKVTFASFYRDWSTRQIWVTSTTTSMDLAANSVTFSNVGLADIRPSHVEAWVKSMQDKDLKPLTIKTRFGHVRTVIRAAVRDRMMARDVTDGVKLPRARKAAAAMTIPTAEEVGAAIRATEDIEPWFGAYIAVCAFAGLRLGEASALKVSDVDFMRKEIQIQRQVQWPVKGSMEIRDPKYGSERTVYVPEELVTLLAEHLRLHQPGDDPDRWVFPGARDDQLPAHAATVTRWWRKVRDKVGIEHRLHDLRHFYASGLIAAGCDVVTVQRSLGHSSPAATLSTYSHLWPDASDRTRSAAAGLVKQALGSTADALRTEA